MNSAHRKPLPGTRLDYFDAREAVEAIQPGAYAKLPYTSRVLAENLVRRCDPATLEASLRQLVERKRDLDFPWYPARVVCHDILGQTALVDLAGLRDAIADKGGDPAQVNPVVPVQLIVDHSLAVECGGYDPEAFANPKLFNEMVRNADGSVKQGSLARVEPEGKVMRMWEAIETYMERKQPLIIVAGADYGQGSSRDWAAKGVRLAGVEAIVAEGFERIHRTNLIGMGVLPLEFKPGTTRLTLGIDGSETFDVLGARRPRADLTLVIHRRDGERLEVPVTCRLDSDEEVSIYEAGGVLQRFAQDFLEAAGA